MKRGIRLVVWKSPRHFCILSLDLAEYTFKVTSDDEGKGSQSEVSRPENCADIVDLI